MAAPPLKVYVDIQTRKLVKSNLSAADAPALSFRQGETVAVQLYFLDPTGGSVASPYPTFYTAAGLAIKVGLCAGVPTGQTDTLIVYQNTWTEIGSPVNGYSGSLNFNTSELTAAIGSASQLSATLEIEITPSGESPLKLAQQAVTIKAAVIDAASTIPTPQEEYITRIEAREAFAGKIMNPGESIIIPNAAGTKAVEIKCGDDGELITAAIEWST